MTSAKTPAIKTDTPDAEARQAHLHEQTEGNSAGDPSNKSVPGRRRLSPLESYNIQVLKGVAISFVVFAHNVPPGLPKVFLRPLFNFPVGLFLFLTGFLSTPQKWNLKKRLIRVLIPYAIWTAAYTAYGHLSVPLTIPKLFITRFVLGDSAAIMYYVFVYCELVFLIPVIDRIAKSRLKYPAFSISFISIIVFHLFPIVFGFEYNNVFSRIIYLSCLDWFIFFYFGYLLGNQLFELRISTKSILICLLIFAGLQMLESYWYYKLGIESYATNRKLTAMLTTFMYCSMGYRFMQENRNDHSFDFIKLLGDYSFGIFFSHLFIMNLLARIPHYSQIAIFPLNAIIALALSTLFVFSARKILGKYSMYLGC